PPVPRIRAPAAGRRGSGGRLDAYRRAGGRKREVEAMPVQSMTGFARHEAVAEGLDFVWELRSVNGKGLDLRLRLPPGFEPIETALRRLAASRLSRGNIQASLQLRRDATLPEFVVNDAMLHQVLALS